jgi:hypothetical protein
MEEAAAVANLLADTTTLSAIATVGRCNVKT